MSGEHTGLWLILYNLDAGKSKECPRSLRHKKKSHTQKKKKMAILIMKCRGTDV